MRELEAVAAVIVMKLPLKARYGVAGVATANCDDASSDSDSSSTTSDSSSVTSCNSGWQACKGHGGSLPVRRLPLRRVVPGTPGPQRPHFRPIDVAAEANKFKLAEGGLRIVNPPPNCLLFAPFERRLSVGSSCWPTDSHTIYGACYFVTHAAPQLSPSGCRCRTHCTSTGSAPCTVIVKLRLHRHGGRTPSDRHEE